LIEKVIYLPFKLLEESRSTS